MTINKNETIAKEWVDAFNEHDVEKLLALYHDDATHYSPSLEAKKPETKGWLVGKEQLKNWWQSSFNDLPDLFYELKDLTISESKVFMEYVRKVTGQQNKYVIEYLRIEKGVIVESRVLRGWELDS